jgi:hypothetical protein
LQFQQLPSALYSSPDGSCFLAVTKHDHTPTLRAYHWATFGMSEGIPIDLPTVPGQLVLTSFVNRISVHLLCLDTPRQSCRSFALDITKKATEFMLKQKGTRVQCTKESTGSLHNSLVECHSEVWTRFPVVAAVRRRTFLSSERQRRAIVFVADCDHQAFSPRFLAMIRSFEKDTKKPTDDELRSIEISATTFEDFVNRIHTATISRFRAGEWLVDLLCLLPIHIALAQENRFIPLKDGVLSAEVERSLLGAEVGQIVDSLSFGWYESLFQSYQSHKVNPPLHCMGFTDTLCITAGESRLLHGSVPRNLWQLFMLNMFSR